MTLHTGHVHLLRFLWWLDVDSQLELRFPEFPVLLRVEIRCGRTVGQTVHPVHLVVDVGLRQCVSHVPLTNAEGILLVKAAVLAENDHHGPQATTVLLVEHGVVLAGRGNAVAGMRVNPDGGHLLLGPAVLGHLLPEPIGVIFHPEVATALVIVLREEVHIHHQQVVRVVDIRQLPQAHHLHVLPVPEPAELRQGVW